MDGSLSAVIANTHACGLRLNDLSDRQGKLPHPIAQSIADFHAACEDAGITRRQVVQETERPFHKLIDLARTHDLVIFGLKKFLTSGLFAESPQE